MRFIFFVLMPVLVMGRPGPQEPVGIASQNQNQNQQNLENTPIPIINSDTQVGEDGSLNFSYETGNGIHYQQSAYTKKIPSAENFADEAGGAQEQIIQVMTGSYSYQAPDGTLINLTYVADENGFQPQGDHLPTPPPIPEAIQKVLNSLPQNDDQQQQPQQQDVNQFARNNNNNNNNNNPQ